MSNTARNNLDFVLKFAQVTALICGAIAFIFAAAKQIEGMNTRMDMQEALMAKQTAAIEKLTLAVEEMNNGTPYTEQDAFRQHAESRELFQSDPNSFWLAKPTHQPIRNY